MRRYTLFFIVLCLHVAARGQTIADIDLSGLPQPTQAKALRYWFDDKGTAAQTVSQLSGQQELDVSSLLDGLHTIHFQVIDSEDKVATPYSRIFLKTGSSNEAGGVKASKLIYWFDNDTTLLALDVTDGVQMLDASEMIEGLHTLHYQVLCNNGQMTPAMSSMFLRLNIDTETAAAKSLRYWFDDGQEASEVEITDGVQLLDASDLLEGLHTIHYQIMGSTGMPGVPCTSVFLKIDADMTSATARSVRYWFDDDAATVNVIDVANGTQTLDVADMPIGLHTLNYQLIDSNGKVGIPVTRLFMKSFDTVIASGHNSIIKYQYWLNGNTEAVQTVAIDEPVNPYTLIALLPMQQEPFRSSSFHFENKDGKPMMYAKNDFYVRFTDAAGYCVDDSRPFTDYSISREVKPVGELQATQTFAKVAENDVRWYTIQVAPGDTTAFKLSQPATVQVFAPSGAEVFKTSESASVKWGGIHTWENGTYYLAVHDVTGTQSTMKLDYMHMDKYDVVDWDVHRVGNGGCSTITFKGNGFRDLYAVDLVIAPGDTVRSVAVSHDSDAETAVTFDFTGATLGDYNAVFHFTEEDKPVANVVTVEEAKEIELALNVTCPSSFLSGTATTYTVTVTNKGNATAYDVPMEIYLSAGNSFSNIQSVKFKDEYGKEFNNFTLDEIEKDSIDDETMAYIDELIQELDGLHVFIVKNDSTGEGEYGFTDQLITIAPNSSSTFYVEIKSSSTVNLKARIPSDWLTVHSQYKSNASKLKRANPFDRDWCCEKEKWECTVGLLMDGIGLIPVAGCASAIVDLATFTTFEIACADGNSLGSKELDFYRSLAKNKKKRESAINKVINGLLGCISGALGKAIKAINDKLKAARKARQAAQDAAKLARDERAKALQSWEYLKNKGDEAYAAGNIDEARIHWESSDEAWENANRYLKEAEEKDKEAASLLETITNLEKELFEKKNSLKDFIDKIKDSIKENSECVQAWKKAEANCPPDPDDDDDTSTPYIPRDPNDIFGPLSVAGSKFIVDSLARVNYTIEFENDTTLAKASAHTIVIKDTLDSRYFDLNAFMPTGVRIGSREVFLNEADVVTNNDKTTFVKTIDMRPEINAIAQVDGEYNQKKGIAEWRFTSLDPMTMEPTNDLMQGILPVNYDGTSGIGEVMFEIGVKQGKADGAQIKNRAGIVFDYEEAILTPTWTNIVDAVAPSSVINNSWMVNDSTLRITADGFDERSGVWKYTWYVQAGENAPWWKEGETESPQFDYHIFEGIDYGFCVLATDSAGNVEQKVIQRERSFKTYGQDFEDRIDEANGQSSMVNGQSIYDLSGRRQAVPKENQVNIIDKKKVLIR